MIIVSYLCLALFCAVLFAPGCAAWWEGED